MATGRYVSDLEAGDVLGPVEFTLSAFAVREYCHAVELHQECFQGTGPAWAPPTMVHLEKLRLYGHACPAGTGPTARVHYQFSAEVHDRIPVGTPLRVTGRVTRRYVKRARDFMDMEITLTAAADGRPLVTYRDTVALAYATSPAAGA